MSLIFYPEIENIEESRKRKEINLFYKDFLLKIEKINSSFDSFRKYLSAKIEWYNELSKFRHPSTHRIPLYVIPSVLNKSESEKYIYHQVQHLEEAGKLNFESADEHLNQINSLGAFIPLFAHDPDVAPLPAYPTIITDCENIAEIANRFLGCLSHNS